MIINAIIQKASDDSFYEVRTFKSLDMLLFFNKRIGNIILSPLKNGTRKD